LPHLDLFVWQDRVARPAYADFGDSVAAYEGAGFELLEALPWRAEAELFAERIASPFLFFFDTAASTKSQFVAMSIGGYVASALAAVLALALLPRDQLAGQVGLAIVGIGIVATLVAELPTTIRVSRGGPMPRGYVYRSGSPAD